MKEFCKLTFCLKCLLLLLFTLLKGEIRQKKQDNGMQRDWNPQPLSSKMNT